ncbi:cytochrome P450 [Streptomyces nojiriensis]
MSAGLGAVPQAPGHLPLLGHTAAMLRDRLGFLASLPAHGELVRLRFGPQTMVLVCDPELVQQVLRDDRTFDKGGPFFDRAREIVGDGLASCPHDRHRRQRRLCQPAFRPTRLPDYTGAITAAACEETAAWSDGDVIDIDRAMPAVANRALARTMFSSRLPAETTGQITEDTTTLMNSVIQRMLTPAPFDRAPTPGHLRYERARRRLRQTVTGIVADRRADGAVDHDLLSALLSAADPETTGDGPRSLTDEEIADQLVTFFIAGTETTAGLLSWVLYELARHPGIQERLHAHTDGVLRGRLPQAAELPALTYTEQVINESLRLHSPVWLLTRTVTTDARLGGVRLPAGTAIAISPYTVHWNPALHPRPRAFDPDRWNSRSADRSAYLPFGSGPRRCIGDRFALREAAVVLSVLISSWRFAMVTERPPRSALSASYVPRGLRLRVHARRPGLGGGP